MTAKSKPTSKGGRQESPEMKDGRVQKSYIMIYIGEFGDL